MGFSIFDICRFALLLLNAMAILNERRFLNRYGIVPPNGSASSSSSPTNSNNNNNNDWGDFGGGSNDSPTSPNDGSAVSVKQQVGQLLFSVRLLLRWPIVIANVIMIVLTILFG